jgi:hypothetical protein
MSNILKFILIGAGILILVAYIGIGFYISNISKGTIANGISQAYNEEADHLDMGIVLYDKLQITGTEVINFIKEHKTDLLFVRVKTKACISLYGVYYNYTYEDEKLTEAGTYSEEFASKENYINKKGLFRGEILKDDLGVIIGIAFEQK